MHLSLAAHGPEQFSATAGQDYQGRGLRPLSPWPDRAMLMVGQSPRTSCNTLRAAETGPCWIRRARVTRGKRLGRRRNASRDSAVLAGAGGRCVHQLDQSKLQAPEKEGAWTVEQNGACARTCSIPGGWACVRARACAWVCLWVGVGRAGHSVGEGLGAGVWTAHALDPRAGGSRPSSLVSWKRDPGVVARRCRVLISFKCNQVVAEARPL